MLWIKVNENNKCYPTFLILSDQMVGLKSLYQNLNPSFKIKSTGNHVYPIWSLVQKMLGKTLLTSQSQLRIISVPFS